MGAQAIQTNSKFDYDLAFSRNLGWFSPEDQKILKQSTVGIAGLGGVGGYYCESLARLGVGNFVIADFDVFEIQNFNRQMGASMSTLGQRKLEVMKSRIHDINPEAKITLYPKGLSSSTINEFVDQIDVYVDALDFFAFDERAQLIAQIQRVGKHSVTAAPLGFGTSLIVFGPKTLSFDQYFRFSSAKTVLDKSLLFLLGLAPSLMHRKALNYKQAVDIANHKMPSTSVGCFLSAGVAASTVAKILLKRGPIKLAPWVIHFDSYLNATKKNYVPFGNGFILNRLKLWIIKRILNIGPK